MYLRTIKTRSPEEEVLRLAEAAEAQDTKGTEADAVQANKAVEGQETEAGTEREVEEEAGSSFESINEDQGIITVSSTKSEEGSAPPEVKATPFCSRNQAQ
jgi:hypothetical protein